jgi:hypothetical protein
MRVSVCNWQTSDADVDRAVAAVAKVMRDRTTRHARGWLDYSL